MLSRLCSSAASARTLPLIHAARAASTLATASRQQQQQQQRQQQQRRSGLVGLLGAAAAAVVGMGVANAEDKKKKTNEKLTESDGGLLYTYEEDGVKKAILFTKSGATEVNLDTPAPAEEAAPQPKKASEAEVKAAVTKLTDNVAGLERALGYLPPSQQSKGDNGFPKFTAKSKSLLKKHLTKDVYLQCKDRVTPSGFTLDQAMQSGVDNQDSGVGLYAGDEAAYTVFAPLFDRIIEDYHGGYKPDAKHTSDLDVSKVQGNLTDAGDAIVSTRIRVGRNIRGLGLSPGISRAERREVERIVVKALNNMTGDLAGKYYSLGAMTEAERKQLVDDHFLFKKGDRFLQSAGANRDWPESRGIFHNQEKTFLVWLNEEDQLRIISMQPGGDVKGIFDRLVRAINAIEAEVKAAGYEFSYNDHLGFIHSCPTNCGTGMRASVHVKLANASKHPQFNEWCDKLRLQPRGIHGEHSETDGGVFDISNKERLGKSEVQLVQTMIDGVNALLQADAALAKGESAEAVSKRILG